MNELNKPVAYGLRTKIAFLIAIASIVYLWVAHGVSGFSDLHLASLSVVLGAQGFLLIMAALDLWPSERRLGKFSERWLLLEAYEPNILKRPFKIYRRRTLLAFLVVLILWLVIALMFPTAVNNPAWYVDDVIDFVVIGFCTMLTTMFASFVSLFVDLLALQNELAKLKATGMLANVSTAREDVLLNTIKEQRKQINRLERDLVEGERDG